MRRWLAQRATRLGLRARIIGVVVITTAVTLSVAALALLPRLESKLRDAAMTTLKSDVAAVKHESAFSALQQIQYEYLQDNVGVGSNESAKQVQQSTSAALASAEQAIRSRLSANTVALIGYIDQSGVGRVVVPLVGSGQHSGVARSELADLAGGAPYDDVREAYLHRSTVYSIGRGGGQVRAAIWLGDTNLGMTDAVLVVRRSIDEVPQAVKAVREAALIAAIPGVLLTLILAFPLAATVVRRLQRLRESALQLAVDGSDGDFPIDRSRDEIGDLSRSFAIVQRRLRQQERARRAFVSTASHELRTPLTSLSGMLELLDEDLNAEPADLDDARELLERAREQARRLAGLAGDLLDLSRLDAEVSLRSEPVELTEVARAVEAEFEVRARATSDVRLELRTVGDASGGAWALGDPGSIARIIRILIDNALRVAPPASAITVTITAAPNPTISVTDTGPGVPPAERQLIFERFQRGRDATANAGFGLGLAIGRELADRMGGSLLLLDEDEPGTTFRLRLKPIPVASEPPDTTH